MSVFLKPPDSQMQQSMPILTIRKHDDSFSVVSSELIFPEIKTKIIGGAFPKDNRFYEPCTDTSITASLDYNPNYDIKYKKTSAAVIKRDENLEQLKKKKKDRLMMLLPELTTSEKVNLSIMTADTDTNIGPGAYSVNYGAVEIVTNVGLSKASRFEASKKEDTLGLQINYDHVEKKAGRAIMKPPVLLNSKLMKKRQLQDDQARVQAHRELALMREKDQRAKDRPRQMVQVRDKTEKERILELFRLVCVCYL
jgi:hypothetical protein